MGDILSFDWRQHIKIGNAKKIEMKLANSKKWILEILYETTSQFSRGGVGRILEFSILG